MESIPAWVNLPAYAVLLVGGFYIIKALLKRLDDSRKEVRTLQIEKDALNDKRVEEVREILEGTHSALDRLQTSIDSMMRVMVGKHGNE